MSKLNKTIEETFKKLSPREHVLHRPNMYIGNTQLINDDMWVFDFDKNQITKKQITFSPAFLKIFDEVLTNALDHSCRDLTVSQIKITIDKNTNEITIYNNGHGIPVVIHKEYNIYVPQLIFGNLLSSSNYDDDEERKVAGTNGIGVKCIGYNTKIPLYNGKIILSQELKLNDILIGDDGEPRTINYIEHEKGQLYKIKPLYGKSYTVNENHILTFKCILHNKIYWRGNYFILYYWDIQNNILRTIKTNIFNYTSLSPDFNNFETKNKLKILKQIQSALNNNNVFDINIQSYLKIPLIYRKFFKNIKVQNPVNWPYKQCNIDPYFFGEWLSYNTNKYIPPIILHNSVDVRCEFLGGFCDNSIENKNISSHKIKIYLSNSNKIFIQNFIYLINSLGFIYKKQKYLFSTKIVFWGNLSLIKSKVFKFKSNTDKNNHCGYISINKLNKGSFVSLQISNNKRFLINDFIVTHNCTNIYSKKFTIETVEDNMYFSQTYNQNMAIMSKPVIKQTKNSSYTKITFYPDYEKFNMKNLTDDTINLLTKRIYDCIATTNKNVNIYLNNTKLLGKGLQDYVKYYNLENTIYYDFYNDNNYLWEWAVIPNSIFDHVSFVNGNNTYKGGKHVEYLITTICNKLKKQIETKKKIKDLKISHIRDKMFLFLSATIKNPQFNSQTKEELITPYKDFNCKIEVSDKFITKLFKSEITNNILETYKLQQLKDLNKQNGKKKTKINIPKLEDALWAGTVKSNQCSLILTEGLSAMTFAIWGRNVVKNGLETLGVFPLKGKCVEENTKILLWNGTVKLAKNISVNDILIGDDGTPRNVLNVFYDTDTMYTIKQEKFGSYTVNSQHTLSLKMPKHKFYEYKNNNFIMTYWDFDLKCAKQKFSKSKEDLENFAKQIPDNNIIDIPIKDFIDLPKFSRQFLTHYRPKNINWPYKPTKLNPYCVGNAISYSLKRYYTKKGPLFLYMLKHFKQLENCFDMYKEYVINSRNVRLELLAGILDYIMFNTKTYSINLKLPLNNSFVLFFKYLCLSLGFPIKIHNKYIILYGNLHEIPLKRKKIITINQNKSISQIKIFPQTNKKYVGITIDGNHRFLVDDFIATHNCLNVRDATHKQLIENEEINNIIKILGLKHNEKYTDTKNLRYNNVILLTDSDVDGSHIKSLLVNFIHYFWPELLKLNFIQTIRTPIVIAKNNKETIEFYTEQDYNNWLNTKNPKNYTIKYYKGLGTSKKEEAQNIFKNKDKLCINYCYKNKECDEAILLAFQKDNNKTSSNARKNWLENYNKNNYINSEQNNISFSDLINKELIHFSIYDNSRSIPSIIDGFKPSQRKILHYMLNKLKDKEIKVAQLSGYVSAETHYHHGEASLQQAIINMAQNFIGSNNLNLLQPEGNFGTRWVAGDHASPRYIFTKLSSYTFILFDENDNKLVPYLYDDGYKIEPEYFMPIIPTVLLNGISGIGTGYSTNIPSYNINDIIDNIINLINNKPLQPLIPYFKNFKGKITKIDNSKYMIYGVCQKIGDKTLNILEIPVGTYITSYKEFLESLESSNEFGIKNIINKTTDENNGVNFVIEFNTKENLNNLMNNVPLLYQKLKLTKTITLNNMYLFDENLKLKKFNDPNDIIKKFYNLRLSFYEKRKTYLLDCLKDILDKLTNKMNFINEYLNNTILVHKQKINFIIEQLENKNYLKINNSYDYLTNMPLSNMTYEKINELKETINNTQIKYNTLIDTPIKKLWLNDIEKLRNIL